MTMMTSHRAHSSSHTHLRLDIAGLLLFLLGVSAAAFAYWLVSARGLDPLLLVPGVVAATTGARHLLKREVDR